MNITIEESKKKYSKYIKLDVFYSLNNMISRRAH